MNERKIPDALLERYLADDLDPGLRARLAGELAGSDADRARLEELERDSAAFLARHPPGPLVARFEEKRRRRPLWHLLAPVALAAAAASVLVFALRWTEGLGVDRQGIQLVIYAAETPGAPIRPKPVASQDDAVRFLLESASVGYVAVFGLDEAGGVRLYHPRAGDSAQAYDPQGPMLPGVTRLPPGSRREEVLGVFSPTPFALEPILAALRARRPLEEVVPPGTLTAKVPLLEQ